MVTNKASFPVKLIVITMQKPVSLGPLHFLSSSLLFSVFVHFVLTFVNLVITLVPSQTAKSFAWKVFSLKWTRIYHVVRCLLVMGPCGWFRCGVSWSVTWVSRDPAAEVDVVSPEWMLHEVLIWFDDVQLFTLSMFSYRLILSIPQAGDCCRDISLRWQRPHQGGLVVLVNIFWWHLHCLLVAKFCISMLRCNLFVLKVQLSPTNQLTFRFCCLISEQVAAVDDAVVLMYQPGCYSAPIKWLIVNCMQ